MSPADRIEMLRVLGIELRLTGDGRLEASGPQILVEAVRPVLSKHREALIGQLDAERAA